MKFTCVFQIHTSMFFMESCINCADILHAGSNKRILLEVGNVRLPQDQNYSQMLLIISLQKNFFFIFNAKMHDLHLYS